MLLAAVAGAVLPLAFAPFGLFWLAPLAYATLFFLWRDAAPWRAFVLGSLFGFVSFVAGLHWIYFSVHDVGQLPFATSVVLTIALPAVLALYIGAVGAIAARWFPRTGLTAWIGVLPALWVLIEWFRGWLFTGFGWLAAGYTQTDAWLMGYAPVLGIYGMSWAVMLCAGVVVALVLGGKRERGVAAAALIGVLGAGFALGRMQFTTANDAPRTIAIVQGAIPQTTKWDPTQLPPTIALYRQLTEASHGQDLIIWPEAAIPDYFERWRGPLAEIARNAAQHGSALVLGILDADAETRAGQNVVVAMTDPPSTYVKRHLVPFGEFYPVPDFVRAWLRLHNLPSSDMASGDPEQPLLAVGGERIAVTICYEDLFGAEQLHFLPDATLLVNVANDAWFGDSIGPHQHLQIARVRAAEAGRYLLRATNTGVSAVVDPAGATVATLPSFQAGVLTATVRGHTGLTPYARWGNYPVVLGTLLVLAGMLAVRLNRQRRG
ncbi:MAG TPA: apolipoprotein N-acyltransferase [Gammaproteobacteria bacterium]|jgi:apolipoprotein N-acyltransferase